MAKGKKSGGRQRREEQKGNEGTCWCSARKRGDGERAGGKETSAGWRASLRGHVKSKLEARAQEAHLAAKEQLCCVFCFV